MGEPPVPADPDSRLDPQAEADRRLREAGLARTPQRLAVLMELLRRTDHPTAEQLHEVVSRRLPGLSRATVYRVLEALSKHGLLARIPHADSPGRFDGRVDRHHHLLCERCGSLADLDASALAELAIPSRSALNGFRAADYRSTLRGVCPECAGDADRTHAQDKR